jgi:RNA polymerase-interacting CarD/CdnL/TRCF family regulator
MFQVGDAVIHPHRGAGMVVNIEKLQCLGSDKWYYSITLVDGSGTQVWVPVNEAERDGVRQPISKSQLGRVWRILRAEAEPLPVDHKERHQLLQEKISSDVFGVVAEAVRDMFWKDHRVRSLTIEGKRLYERGMMLLASEIAVVQGCDFTAAGAMISDILGASLAAKPAV